MQCRRGLLTMTDRDTTDPTSTPTTTTTISRRSVLAGLGGAAVAGTGLASAQDQDSEGGYTLDISIFQTERMATAAELETGDPAYAQVVAKAYAERFLGQLVEASRVFDDVNVKLRAPAVAIDTAGEYDNPKPDILLRLLDWNGTLHGEYEPSAHSNLLIDTPLGESTIGIAFNDQMDSMRGKMTDACVLDYGTELLKLDPERVPHPEDHTLYIRDDEAANIPEMIGMAAAHEIGHNLKLNHNEGTGLYADERESLPASTVMTGPYLAYYGALKDDPKIPGENACGQEYPEVEADATSFGITEFHDDIAFFPTQASDCEIRSFENDARDLARQGAAGYGAGASAPDRSDANRQGVEDAIVTTELPDAVHERWQDAL